MRPASALPLLPMAAWLIACSGGDAPPPGGTSPANPPPAATASLDPDGVQMLFPSASGSEFRLGQQDPNTVPRLSIGNRMTATAQIEGAVRYWNMPSYPLSYAGGGTGWTSRLNMFASGGQQLYTWRTQPGYLSSPADVRNQELTVYLRIHQILDPAHLSVSLKIRGGQHTSGNGDLASCTMMTFEPASRATTRFGKELTHPDYDYVRLTPAFAAELVEDQWFGLKLLSYTVPSDPRKVVNRLYLDIDPFDFATGTPKNHWRLFSEYVDEAGNSTGSYSTLADWGGWQTTVRVDGVHDVDFALLGVHEITPPQ